jgi:uncharacterized protein
MKETGSAAVPALVAALVLLGLAGGPARAAEPGPSFDCKKAATPVEKTICQNGFIGFRDGALGKLYAGLVDALTDRARQALRRDQRAWLKARNRACGKVGDNARADCLDALYDKRLRRLDRQMRRAGLAPGAGGRGSFAGDYGKRLTGFFGTITVVEPPKGPAWVEISTVAGPTAHTCNLWTRQARREGASLVWRDTDEPKCQVTLTFKGRTVGVKATRACHTQCGARGYFGGLTYTRTGR